MTLSPEAETNYLPSQEEETNNVPTSSSTRFTERVQTPEPIPSVNVCLPTSKFHEATTRKESIVYSDLEHSEVCDLTFLL